MKLNKIYNHAIGRFEDDSNGMTNEEKKNQNDMKDLDESAGRTQIKINWLQSTVTQELFKSMADERNEHMKSAVQLATTFSQHQNHLKIIDLLVRADQLDRLLKQHAKIN